MDTPPTIDEQRKFWNWHWTQRVERMTVNAWKDRRHRAIVAYLASLRLRNPRILDVGCGTGDYTQGLARFGPTTGIDLSETAVEVARSEFPHIEFVVGNLYDYPLSSDHFDVIIAQEVFDHVENQPAFVDRVASLLRQDGHLILSCTNRFVVDRLLPGTLPQQPSHHIAKYLLRHELNALLQRRFRVIRTTSVIPLGQRGILRVVNSYRLNTVVGKLVGQRRLDALKERAGLGYQMIAVARKRR